MDHEIYAIGELAEQADVSTRTVRYYVEQGLLPSPGSRGRSAKYGRGHLDRIQLIKRLQAEHLPLAEIRQQLEALTDEQVAALLQEATEPPPGSPLEYVRGLLGAKEPRPPYRNRSPFDLAAADSVSEPLASMSAPASAFASAPGYDRSRWDRVQIGRDVEIHIRRPLSREQNRRVDELIEIARNLLMDEEAL